MGCIVIPNFKVATINKEQECQFGNDWKQQHVNVRTGVEDRQKFFHGTYFGPLVPASTVGVIGILNQKLIKGIFEHFTC